MYYILLLLFYRLSRHRYCMCSRTVP